MTPHEIARVLGVDLSDDDSKVLEALSVLSVHLERRQLRDFSGKPEVGMLLRIKCHQSAHSFYHGREIIVTHVTEKTFFGFLSDTRKVVDGDLSNTSILLLQYVGKAPREVWEAKYPELKDRWGKGEKT